MEKISYSPFVATDTTRNGDGFHAGHHKPTGEPGQWTLDGKLPPRAFEMHPRERHRFHQIACVAPFDSQGINVVVRSGGELFDATYGAEKEKFTHEILQCQPEIDRLEHERARLNYGLEDVPTPVVTGRPTTSFPDRFTLNWWLLIALLTMFGVSSASALWSIALLYLPTAQSKVLALLIATPWVFLAVGAKILTRTFQGAIATATNIVVALAGLAGLGLWLVGMMPLAAGMSVNEIGATLLPDRRLAFAGQLLCEFASSYLFLTGLFHIIQQRKQAPVVQEIDEIHERLSGINFDLQFALTQMAKAKGNLLEWESSRAAFIEEGITIFHLRLGDAALVRQIEEQRDATRHFLDEFVAKPVDPAPASSPAKTAVVALAAIISAFSATAASQGPLKEFVVGMSPFQPPGQRESQRARVQNFLLTGCPNGSRVVLIDGWNLSTVFDLQLPSLAFDSPAARAPKVLPALDALKRWTALSSDSPAANLKDTAAIKIPQFLQRASGSREQANRVILLLCSPFNLIPEEPDFSMSENRYPSDDHLGRTTAESPYGILGTERRLTNAAIYWAYSSESIWSSARHRDCVERWWSLYVAGQGGVLAGFAADASQLFQTATNANPRAVGNYVINPGDSNMVMHTATKRTIAKQAKDPLAQGLGLRPIAITISNVPSPQPATTLSRLVDPTPSNAEKFSPPVSDSTTRSVPILAPQIAKELPTTRQGNVGVALFWQGKADVDLHVAAKAGLPEAYWKRPNVDLVRHFRDVRAPQSPREDSPWQMAWEYCEVSHVQLSEPVVWLNVYAASEPVSGIIRVQFRGKVEDRPFYFRVQRGNRGRDAELTSRARSPYWQLIKLADFFPD